MTEKVERLMALRGDHYQWFIITSTTAKWPSVDILEITEPLSMWKWFCGMLYSAAETG